MRGQTRAALVVGAVVVLLVFWVATALHLQASKQSPRPSSAPGVVEADARWLHAGVGAPAASGGAKDPVASAASLVASASLRGKPAVADALADLPSDLTSAAYRRLEADLLRLIAAVVGRRVIDATLVPSDGLGAGAVVRVVLDDGQQLHLRMACPYECHLVAVEP